MSRFYRQHVALLLSSSAVMMTPMGSSAVAQVASANDAVSVEDAATSESSEPEITVTGSRIARDGADAPSPVSVLSSAAVQARGITNIADALNEIPALANSATPAQSTASTRYTGSNFVNLRNLGPSRTLVLVDGVRHVPSSDTELVDLNLIPSNMVDRTEVVTGGASALYGSDAVAGVVNLKLRKRFQGFEATAQYGQSEAGDNVEYRIGMVGGFRFAGDRGNITLAFEYVDNDGVDDIYSRDWGRRESGLIANPSRATNGLPLRIISSGIRNATMAPGGIITAGPLRGTTFANDGTATAYNYGALAGTQFMIGGSTYGNNFQLGVNLLPQVQRKVGYGRLEYALTDDIELTFDLSHGRTKSIGTAASPFNFGNLTIRRDNAYLPASVAAAMDAAGVTSFSFGRFWTDVGVALPTVNNKVTRGVIALNGSLGDDFTWDASAQYGESDYSVRTYNSFIPARGIAAIDAVYNGSGQIVCRTNPTGLNAGCVPFNPFGSGNASDAARDYVTETQEFDQKIEQSAYAIGLSGKPLELWAGPLAVAAGVEYRKEELNSVANALAQANAFNYGNPKGLKGSFHVLEGYAESDIPLLTDTFLAKRLSVNGAVRVTDYSTSGTVVTWKAGAMWRPIGDVLVRLTRSRDIRAPNIPELYQPGRLNTPAAIIDPQNGNSSYLAVSTTSGNPNLKPETADTVTFGVTYTPAWERGLRMSVDYFDIKVKDAIGTVTPQDTVDRCFRGDSTLCSLITRDSGGIVTAIATNNINIARFEARGIDAELSYTTSLDGLGIQGNGGLTLLGTKNLRNRSINGAITTNFSGQHRVGGLPKWQATATLWAKIDRVMVSSQTRFISSGVFDNLFVEGVGINDNSIPARVYENLSLSYDFGPQGDEDRLQVFAVVNNLLDQDPPVVPDTISTTNQQIYDVIGRSYRAGVRVKF